MNGLFLTLGRSWEQKMLKFIDNHNLKEQMLTESPDKSRCVAAAPAEIDPTKWYQQ